MTREASPPAAVRHAQRVEELAAAALRALSGDASLRFRGRVLHHRGRPVPIPAPHLHPSPERDDLACLRGAADGMALRLLHSDADLHRALRPGDPVRRLVFEQLEQFRVETFAPAWLPGVASNLRHRFRAWSLAVHRDGLTESARGLLLYAVAQICRARLTGEPVTEETEGLIESARFALGRRLGHDLAGLRRHRADQVAFARHALSIADTVAKLAGAAGGPDEDSPDDEDERDRPRLTLLAEFEENDEETENSATAGARDDGDRPTGSSVGYRVYTSAYDRQDAAAALVRRELLREHRERLDRLVARQAVNVGRLTRDLRVLLADPVWDGWDAGQEEGRVDGRRLAQLISSPTERRLFRAERDEPVADAVVTFLIDCSGSMTAHVESVAVLVDVLARALELAGAACEILGFTTAAWHGGRAHRDWLRAGRPAAPGRLAERRHLVFKDADTSWRQARPSIAALFKADLFREGVDGEAVRWAASRSAERPERRRPLLVLSDGSPMDGATNLANEPHYLDWHLVDVISTLEGAGQEIYGVSVGRDLTAYYGRSRILDTSAASGYGMFDDVLDLLAGSRA